MHSDLLIINVVELALLVRASLKVMVRNAKWRNKETPFVFTNLIILEGWDNVIGWIKKYALRGEVTEPNLLK